MLRYSIFVLGVEGQIEFQRAGAGHTTRHLLTLMGRLGFERELLREKEANNIRRLDITLWFGYVVCAFNILTACMTAPAERGKKI